MPLSFLKFLKKCLFFIKCFHYIVTILLCLTVYCRDIVLLTVGVYSSNHGVLHAIGIRVMRRFQKSVDPSTRPFVTLAKYAYSIMNSRIIIFIAGESKWQMLEQIFQKLHSCFCIIGEGMIFCISGERDGYLTQENCHFRKNNF